MHLKLKILFFFGTLSILCFSQDKQLEKANKKFDSHAYIEASKIYEKVAESGYKSKELFSRLANSYYFNSKYKKAAKWYGELFKLNESLDNIYNLRYSQTLKSIGKERKSKDYYNTYLQNSKLNGVAYTDAELYLKAIEVNSGRYNIKALPINSEGIDFGAAFYGDNKMVFASTRDTTAVRRHISAWDGLPFLNLMETTINSDSSYSKPTKIKGSINSRFHESTPAFTKDGNEMYFTRNVKKAENSTRILKIYKAQLKNNRWTNVTELSINSDNFSNAHPALSSDEKYLYFVSDRPESVGETDLYMVELNNGGIIGEPINLGPKINTAGRESFPFVNEKNELFFSSDGHFGLGGYDVFYIKLKGLGYEGNLLNVGKPINSQYDDIAYVIKDKKGYISSNRPLSKGQESYDNIYSFIETKPIKDLNSFIYGTVTDLKTNEPIKNAIITVLENNDEVVKVQTNEDGFYKTKVNYFKPYIVKASKKDYTGDDGFAEKEQEKRELNFKLDRDVVGIKEGVDLAKLFNVVIYFNLDKYNIRKDAEVELQKIVAAMKQHPELKIHIKSHTDSRASDAYNLTLSDYRANATRQYIINQGIAPDRLTAKGYGETQLVNNCKNGIKCSKKQHQENRRSEFIIEE